MPLQTQVIFSPVAPILPLSSHIDSKMDAPPSNGILWKGFKGGWS